MSYIEENKRLARHWFKLIDEERVEELCEITAPTWKMHGGSPQLPSGPDGIREQFRLIGPINQKWTIEDVIAEGDKVVVRATNTCLQESFLGVPSDGRWQTFTATFIHWIADGKILETWRNADDLGRLLQLGARIEPTASSSAEDEVRRASERYYTALRCLLQGDAGPLMEVWSRSPDVTAMNPYGGRELGWERLQVVFKQVAQLCAGSHVTVLGLKDPLRRVGSELAYEVGIEFAQGTIAGKPTSIRHRVTNIYRREAGGWKMVHRHTDLNPAEQDVSERLQSS